MHFLSWVFLGKRGLGSYFILHLENIYVIENTKFIITKNDSLSPVVSKLLTKWQVEPMFMDSILWHFGALNIQSVQDLFCIKSIIVIIFLSKVLHEDIFSKTIWAQAANCKISQKEILKIEKLNFINFVIFKVTVV